MSNICTCCVLGSGEVVGKILSLSLPPRCGSARAVLSPESQFKIVGTQDDDCYRFFFSYFLAGLIDGLTF